MGKKTVRERIEGRELKLLCIFTLALLPFISIVGMAEQHKTLREVVGGLWVIVTSRDTLFMTFQKAK